MAVTAEELEIVVRANIQDALNKLNELKNKLENTFQNKISSSSIVFNDVTKNVSRMTTTTIDRLSILSKEIEMQKAKIKQLAIEWKAFASGGSLTEDEAIKTYEKYQKANIQLEKMLLRYNDMIGKTNELENKSNDAFEKINSKSNKASKSVLNLGKMFKRVVIAMAIRGVIKQAIEGFNDLAKYSAKFNVSMSNIQASMLQMRNSLSTAFAPIVQALEPALTKVANTISELFTNITIYTTALFTNSKTYIRAKKVTTDYAKSLGEVSDAQNKVTASFDEFNVLNNQTNIGLPSVGDMFEEVEIPDNVINNANKIKQIWEDLKPILVGLAGAFVGFKIGNEIVKIADWINKLTGAKNATKNLTDKMLEKNKVLGKQTQQTETETSMLWNLVPALAGAGAGAWAFKEAMDSAKSSVPSEMPSIDTNDFKEKIESSRQTVYAFEKELETASNNTEIQLSNIEMNMEAWGTNISENVGKVGSNLEKTISSAYAQADASSVEFMNNNSQNTVTWGENIVSNIGKTMASWYSTFTSALEKAWDSFVGFMEGTGEKISNWWGGAKKWVVPTALALGAITLGTATILTSGATLPLFALANGGVLTQPTSILAGEYPNAKSNPEIVTPQNIMYETSLKANVPVMNAIEEMTDTLVDALKGINVYAEFGYDKLKVGLDNEYKRTGNKLYTV